MNPWVLLGGSIALEIAATSLLKASAGFTRPWHGVASILLYSACFWLMASVLTRLPVGVTYAVWSGVGIVAIALIGLLLFHQPLSALQWGCIALIVAGAVGLNLATPANDAVAASGQRVGTGSGPE